MAILLQFFFQARQMEVLFIQGGVKRAVLEVRNWFYQVILKKKT